MVCRGTVTKKYPDGSAEASVVRESACSQDCESCGGCNEKGRTVSVLVDDPIGAEEGDVVTIEGSDARGLYLALLVFLLPTLAFAGGYLLFTVLLSEGWGIAAAAALFLLSLIPAFIANARLRRKGARAGRITEVVRPRSEQKASEE